MVTMAKAFSRAVSYGMPLQCIPLIDKSQPQCFIMKHCMMCDQPSAYGRSCPV